MSNSRQTFKKFISFSEFTNGRPAGVAETSNRKQVLTIDGQMSASISLKLQGRDNRATATTMRSANLTVGIPHDDAPAYTDAKGRVFPALPCVFEAKSDWDIEEI